LRKEAHKLAHFYSIWGAEVLLDEDCAGCQGLCGGVGDSEKAALGLDAKAGSSAEAVAKAGMKEMSDKFNAMGQQVYVDAEKVKESNKAL